jgi:mannose-6-phosphate isomerase
MNRSKDYMRPSFYKLRGVVKEYDWGKKGSSSLVAHLAKASGVIDHIEDDKPYAELWIGDHPSGCSTVYTENGEENLRESIRNNSPIIAGYSERGEPRLSFPYMLKVLSIGAPLSIQAHPDKARAEILHKADPINYPDSNHKPEVGIALTETDLLYGFRPYAEILKLIQKYEIFQFLFREKLYRYASIKLNPSDAKDLYSKILEASSDQLSNITIMLAMHMKERESEHLSPNEKLFIWLYDYFVGLKGEEAATDVGLISSLFLNIVTLHPGEAIFMRPNLIHAYLSGDILEVMANSDNVVRAGLTPKFQDHKTLLSMFSGKPDKVTILTPMVTEKSNEEYFDETEGTFEFKVHRITKVYTEEEYNSVDTPTLIFCQKGSFDLTAKDNIGNVLSSKINEGEAATLCLQTRQFKIIPEEGAEVYLVC